MPLTDIWIRKAKPTNKRYKQADGGGLYIQISPNGAKTWFLGYRLHGKQKTLALGTYPMVSLADARKARDTAKRLVLEGVDPAEQRKRTDKPECVTFEDIALEWYAWKKGQLTEKYAKDVINRLRADVFPVIGSMSIDEIRPPTMLEMLRKIEERGALEMAKRARIYCGQIFRFGIQLGKCDRDPTADLRGALRKKPAVRHHSIVEYKNLPQLLRDIDNYKDIGHEVTRLGLQLATLTILRTSELIQGEWSEVELDGDEPEWSIPTHKMKVKEGRGAHIVPLSRQAVERLKELQKLTGDGKLMFPGHKPGKTISNNTLLYALYRLGYHSRQTTHGFRRIASTILNEARFRSEAIEKQLAHEEKNKIRAAYNAAEYMSERRPMLQWYADFLDALKIGAPIPEMPPRAPSSALLLACTQAAD